MNVISTVARDAPSYHKYDHYESTYLRPYKSGFLVIMYCEQFCPYVNFHFSLSICVHKQPYAYVNFHL